MGSLPAAVAPKTTHPSTCLGKCVSPSVKYLTTPFSLRTLAHDCLLAASALLLGSCKKDKVETPKPVLAVYAAGYETNAAGKAVAKVWKNGTATPALTDGTKDDSASALAVAGGDVYVSGSENNALGVAVAKTWKNGTATDLTDGTKSTRANALAVVGGDVYAVGYEFSAANVKVAKYWKGGTGTAFTATPITDGGKDSEIRAIVLAP